MEIQKREERDLQKPENGTDKDVLRGRQPRPPLHQQGAGYQRIRNHASG